ncbi:PREDICTED: transmembrane channel-like protein 4 [Cercocebus atys]|uniref:transmembrane channel-like protein 4 n=1 Tax=Cercocebus atys TaxID=9531 RepID=UPI0005F56B99|nr:PREDICTED: transmembrane channel-like protein 4 [Cercocebus atys]
MEENPTLESEAWGSSRGWLAPREARGGPSLSSVLNELPSAATLRYRGPGVLPWGVPEEEEEAGGRSRKAFTEVTQTELQDPHPSRELPWPMQARRAHRSVSESPLDFAFNDSFLAVLSHPVSPLSSVSGLKQTLLAESGDLTSYSHRVFSAWNFGLCGDVHVRLRQRIILYELQVELEETVVRRQAAVRTLGQEARVWLVRVLLNLLVIALLGGAFYGIYWATENTMALQETPLVQELPLLKFRVNYLPSIFIAGVNFVLPPVFKLIAPLEGYTRIRQIVFILLRTVFLRLASLVVLLFSLWKQITCGGDSEAKDCKTCGYNYKELPCWETVLGQEMYKLLLFDLLTALAVALLIQFPRKLLCGLCPGALGRLAGTQEFQVPNEVLGLIYAQTVVWVGSFFCPLLPLLNTVKFLLLFYLKKLTLFSTCSPAARTFRASTANFFFPLVLLLGLAISIVPLLYSIFLIPPSKLCGPFREQSSIWAQIPESISSLPETTQNFLFFLGTQAFATPLLLISSILMAYTVARANSYGRLISELKRQRETEAQNKVFLARRAVALTSTKPAL